MCKFPRRAQNIARIISWTEKVSRLYIIKFLHSLSLSLLPYKVLLTICIKIYIYTRIHVYIISYLCLNTCSFSRSFTGVALPEMPCVPVTKTTLSKFARKILRMKGNKDGKKKKKKKKKEINK